MIQRRRRWFRGENMGPGWRFVWLVLYRPFVTLIKPTWLHLDRVPADGPAIFVTNHVSHVDPFMVAAMVLDAGRTPRFLAKESIFEVPVVGSAMRWMGHIPVRRGSSDAQQSLAPAVDALHNGRVIVLHPEGTVTRDPDGWPMVAKTGAARLAALVPDTPVIPLAQWGVQNSIDLYRKKVTLRPRPRHTVSVGAPIDLSRFAGLDATPAVLRDMTDVIMKRLRTDVAELRGLPAPTGELYRHSREEPAGVPDDAADAAPSAQRTGTASSGTASSGTASSGTASSGTASSGTASSDDAA